MESQKNANSRRHQRATSNVLAKLDQTQIEELKETFNLIDQDRDGFIDKKDLKQILASFGEDVSNEIIDAMIGEAPGGADRINFPAFLTMFAKKMAGTDPEDVIRSAFQLLDKNNTGKLDEKHLRELLTTMGDRYTQEKVDELFSYAPIKNGLLDCKEFISMLTNGIVEDKDDKDSAKN